MLPVFYIETETGRKVVSTFDEELNKEWQVGDTLTLKYGYEREEPEHIIRIYETKRWKDKFGIEVLACYANEMV